MHAYNYLRSKIPLFSELKQVLLTSADFSDVISGGGGQMDPRIDFPNLKIEASKQSK